MNADKQVEIDLGFRFLHLLNTLREGGQQEQNRLWHSTPQEESETEVPYTLKGKDGR